MIKKLTRLGSVLFLVLILFGLLTGVRSANAILAREIIVANSGNDEHLEAIAFNCSRGEYLVIWSKDVGGGDTDLWGRRAKLRPMFSWIGDPFPIAETASPERAADVAFDPLGSEHFLVVYESKLNESDIDIKGQRVAGWAGGGDGGSQLLGSPIEIASTIGRETLPSVAFLPSTAHFLVVFEFDGDIWGQRVAERGQGDSGGELLGSGFAISTDIPPYQSEPAVAVSTLQSYFVVSYSQEYRPGESDLRAQRVKGMVGTGNQLISNAFEIAYTAYDEHASDIVYAPLAQAFAVIWQSDWGNNKDVWGVWLDEKVMSGNPVFVGPFAIAINSTAQEYSPKIDIDPSNGETAISLSYETTAMPHSRLGLIWLDPNPLAQPIVKRPLFLFPERPFSFVDPQIRLCRGQPELILGYSAQSNSGAERDAHFLAANRWAITLPIILR